jgi:hypothetical protein
VRELPPASSAIIDADGKEAKHHQSVKAKSLGRHICTAELTYWVVDRISGGNMLNLFNSLLNLFMPIKSQNVWFWQPPLQVPLVSNEVYLQDICLFCTVNLSRV